MSSRVPLTERVAATLKRHAEERFHFDERHAKELHELTDSRSRMSADDCEAVRPAIPSLVQLLKLSGGASVAASTMLRLSRTSDTARDAIREAGAIPPLVALLHAGAESKAAEIAAQSLCVLACNPTCSDAILAAVVNAAAPLHAFSELQRKLRSVATARLHRAEAGETVVALEAALATAAAVGAADEAVTERVRSRLEELQTAAARRARRESVGLNVPLPADFTCPITYDKMKDPVVASDGHSYERSAIEEILRGPHPLSPLTRATLGTALVPNLNLRRRIEDHEAELDRMAEQMAARLATAVAEAESAANVKEAAAEAKEAAAEAKEAAAYAKDAAANAEIEALRKQLADAKKRIRTEEDHHKEDHNPPAPPRSRGLREFAARTPPPCHCRRPPPLSVCA